MLHVAQFASKARSNRIHDCDRNKEAIQRPFKHESVIVQDVVDFIYFGYTEELDFRRCISNKHFV